MAKNKIRFELRLTKSEWSSLFLTIKKRDIDKLSNDPECKDITDKLIARNAAIDEYQAFRKQMFEDKFIPGDQICEFPSNSLIYKEILAQLDEERKEYLLRDLFKRSHKSFYFFTISRIKNPHTNEDSKKYTEFEIARHAFLIGRPFVVQDLFEYLSGEFSLANTEDEKQKVYFDFHKSFRQADPLDNGHADSILWNLLQISEEPINLIEHVLSSVKMEQEISN